MIPQDYHMHSSFSCDCQAPMAEMCQAAAERGIPEIGFSEHYDLHPGDACRDWLRLEAWAEELERCRAAFAGRLAIRAGVEIGEPHLFADQAGALLERHSFDYVLGSLHWVGQASVFDLDYYNSRPPAEACGLYFDELERLTRLGGFDILSHFDVILRLAYRVYGAYDPRPFEDTIRRILGNCIERGIALDINAAMLRRKHVQHLPPMSLLTPGPDILRWYVEMGGTRITLGSDAHKPPQVGAGLEVAVEAARQAGLTHLTFFQARQPRAVPLPL